MTTSQNALSQLADTIAAISDPAERARAAGAALAQMPDVQATLRQTRQAAVQELRAAGASHQDVATALGVSRARAAQIADGKTSRAATPAE